MAGNPLIIHSRIVEFSETDRAGIVHFSNFFKWMESAEAQWFRSVGVPLIETTDGVTRGWPRVRVKADFHEPVLFDDKVETHLTIKEVRIRAIVYGFRFYKIVEDSKVHVATGSMTTVFAHRVDQTGEMQSAAIPDLLLKAAEAASADG
ncbi:MAG: thioesterase family protein [Verrucomicrobiota bacterium]